MQYPTTSRIVFLYIGLLLLVANINALVDLVHHPEIPYFDDEHLIVGLVNGVISTILFWLVVRYTRQLHDSLRQNREVLDTNVRLIADLEESLSKVRVLSGMLPICSTCKKIRNDQGEWLEVESYINERTDANFTHSLCPTCSHKLYPFLDSEKHTTPHD